jgi:hypothetical protein
MITPQIGYEAAGRKRSVAARVSLIAVIAVIAVIGGRP